VVFSARLLRRVPAVAVAAALLAAMSCGAPMQWENLNLRYYGDLPRPLRGTITDATCGIERTCLVLQSAPGSPGTIPHAWTGIGWTVPAAGPPLTKVSCGMANRCAAITADGVAGWDGTRWQNVTAGALWGELAPGLGRYDTAVSCGLGWWVAIDSGRTATWDGLRWTASTSRVWARDLSCSGPEFCLAAGGSGDVSRWDGATWSTVARISHPGDGVGITAVSCWDSTGCVVAGRIGRMPLPGEPFPPTGGDFLFWWNGTTLMEGTAVAGALDVACTFPQRCIAVRGQQPPLVFTDTERREPPVVLTGSPAPTLTTVTCTTDMCLAGGHTGEGSTAMAVVYRWNFGPYR
jgi:hypothetical protein